MVFYPYYLRAALCWRCNAATSPLFLFPLYYLSPSPPLFHTFRISLRLTIQEATEDGHLGVLLRQSRHDKQMLLQAASQMEDFVADVVSNYLVKPGGFLCGIAHTLAALATIMQRYAAILSVATVSVLLFIFYLPPTPHPFFPGNQKKSATRSGPKPSAIANNHKTLGGKQFVVAKGSRDIVTSSV